MTRKITRRFLLISTAAISAFGAQPIAHAIAADSIKLGVVAPMSGPNARYGAFSLRGAQLAVKDINDTGGINGNPAHYDKVLYRQRYRIENMFGRIKDWRRIATRYDRCAHTFLSAILIVATCCYWLD